MKLLEKIRRQPENVKKIVAALITAFLMIVIGGTWILTIQNKFNFGIEEKNTNGENTLLSPLDSLKENFAAIKGLSATLPQGVDNGIKNQTIGLLDKIKRALNK